LITAIFISSIVLVIILMGIAKEASIEPPAAPTVPRNAPSPTGTTAPTGTSSGGATTVSIFSHLKPGSHQTTVRLGGSGAPSEPNGDANLGSSSIVGRWGSRIVNGMSDSGGPPRPGDSDAPALFTEKLGLPKFSMDSQLIGIIIIVILVLLVLLRNMQAKKKKGSRRVRRKSSK
jgi:hypothetical protein